jgi:hypothetical protein
MLMEHHPSHLN